MRMTRTIIILFISALLPLTALGQEDSIQDCYKKLLQKASTCVFADDFKKSWERNWHLDGKNARIIQDGKSLEMHAGTHAFKDEDHIVLWTKKEFEGNIRIEYDFTRLDSSEYYFVNILYIQAQGIGQGEYKKDIFKWNHLREVPAMSTYFNHMETYHISYAVTGVPAKGQKEYIRARRYMPQWGKGLKGTDLYPEYLDTGLFKIGIKYHLTFIKYGTRLFLNVKGDGKDKTFFFNADNFPPILKGRIGLRQMYTRNSRYENFKIYRIND